MQISHPNLVVVRPNTFLHVKGWLASQASSDLFDQLANDCWKLSQGQKVLGKRGPYWSPTRRMGRFGDPGVTYDYKGTPKPIHALTGALGSLRDQVVQFLGVPFNCAVVNFYSGEDSLYPHSDGDYIPQLGENPVIAAVSLGGTRMFDLIHRDKILKPFSVPLAAGDLFVMCGESQAKWKHGLHSEPEADPRISITFRNHIFTV